MSYGITNNNITYNSNVTYNIIVFCLQKDDAFEDWALIHGATSPEDEHMNGLLKIQLSHLVGIYGHGEPGPDFSLNSTI